MLILLAAGLASTAAGYLVQSDLLPALGSQIWDTSRLLSDDSALGKTLGVLIGYKSAPAGIQLAFYLTTLALLTAGMRWQQKRATPPSRSSPVPRESVTRIQH
jgi:high-affinity iron transporter